MSAEMLQQVSGDVVEVESRCHRRWAVMLELVGGNVVLSSYAFTLLVIFYIQVKHGLRSLQGGCTVCPLVE